ncbi:DUF305 domain-containing protein (plasmid) [Deinococcus sp. KNUC1210]|uniref:DUF305 domain-containing protein n=1 Tax=Deinococcus sp. KNUC1210 TaxID=2917691 RepID=UPI001EF0EB39|nr:DUF305 domain-containing protein [Deinococcus sp. KNUC1210]ULH17836.1 DUF305 domain-containing protein [Deinococcus sp. KNUC1210]
MKNTLPLLTAVLIGTVFAQTSMHHSAAPMASQSMDVSGLKKLSGHAFDRAFLSMMIPHHQAAVDMSRAVLPLSKDAQVKTWAKAIITAQLREIGQMNTLLSTYGGTDMKMANIMKSSLRGMGEMVKMSKNPDVAFVQGMLPHHSSAVDMAKLALEKTNNPQLLRLARDIVTAQAGEMYAFRTWLLKRGL